MRNRLGKLISLGMAVIVAVASLDVSAMAAVETTIESETSTEKPAIVEPEILADESITIENDSPSEDISEATDYFFTGHGTESDPYLILNGKDFMDFAAALNDPDQSSKYIKSYFKLYTDIDLFNIDYTPAKEFSGTLDGAGHTIKNINITVSEGELSKDNSNIYIGLFEKLTNSATIKDLTVEDATVNIEMAFSEDYSTFVFDVGMIAGYAYTNNYGAHTQISKCKTEGSFVVNKTGAKYVYVGGIVGGIFDNRARNYYTEDEKKNAILYDCVNNANVSLISEVNGEDKSDAYAERANVAGLAGRVSQQNNVDTSHYIIFDCKNKGKIVNKVKCTYSTAAGLVCVTDGNISSCTNFGEIESKVSAGGAFGEINGGRIKDCINASTGTVTAKDARGFAEEIWSRRTIITLDSCANNASVHGDDYAMGFTDLRVVGNGSTFTMTDCYNSGEVTAKDTATGMFGLVHFDDDYGKIEINNCYNEGTIKGGNSYGIANSLDFEIKDTDSSYFKMTNCYNAGDIIATDQMNGDAAGIAGWLGGYGKIINCYNEGKITGRDASGIFDSYLNREEDKADMIPEITGCYNSGEITGVNNAGGIIAYPYGDSLNISSCYNTGKITASYAGGLIGNSSAYDDSQITVSISNSYNSGDINGIRSIGGLVGCASSAGENVSYYIKIDKSYNVGKIVCYTNESKPSIGGLIGDVHNVPTSSGFGVNITSSVYINNVDKPFVDFKDHSMAGCYKKTDAEMKMESTYTSLGWDFNDVWDMGVVDYLYPVIVNAVSSAASVGEQISGSVKWKIDSGKLVIYATGNWEKDSNGKPPWYDKRKSITGVEIKNLSGVTDVSSMFEGMTKVKTLDLNVAEADFTTVTVADNMLSGCSGLVEIKTPVNFSVSSVKINDGKTVFYDEQGNEVTTLPVNDLTSRRYLANKAVKAEIFEKSDGKKWHGSVNLSINDNLFAKNSRLYNHDLARFAANMSMICYSDQSNGQNIKTALNDMGFENYEYHKYGELLYSQKSDGTVIDNTSHDSEYSNKYNGEYSPYWIAHKSITVGGTDTKLVGVFIRGTSGKEWYDNFEAGTSKKHKGFSTAADKLYADLKTYIDSNGLSNGNTRILITGHSRGAAVANLLGAKIDDEGIGGISPYVSADNEGGTDRVWTFTFACPNTSNEKRDNRLSRKYLNIVNVVNPEDFVTKVIPSKWGYGRYGITYVLPSSTTEDNKDESGETGFKSVVNYKKYLSEVTDIIQKEYFGASDEVYKYDHYSKGMTTVSKYVDSVTSAVKNINEYHNMKLISCTLKELYKDTLAMYMASDSEGKNKAIWNFISYAGESATTSSGGGVKGAVNGGKHLVPDQTTSYFVVNQAFSPNFEWGHISQTYAAGMQALTKEQLCVQRSTLKGIVNCPVDVKVTNSEGKVVGEITNNEVVDEESDITMAVDGDSKTFYLPANGDFKVELIGNGDGVMNYSLCEYDPDTGETKRVFYKNLNVDMAVGAGSKYVQDITAGADISTLVLKNADDIVIDSTSVISEADLGTLTVSTTVEGNGQADELGNLTQGDYVSIGAYPDEDNVFEGWYDNGGNLVSQNNPYAFTITESVKLVARFREVPDAFTVDVLEGDTIEYNGKPIKPSVKVSYKEKPLTENTDYIVTYKNNVNAYDLTEGQDGFDYNKAPTIIVTGKGDYQGVINKTFVIKPISLSISGNRVSVSDVTEDVKPSRTKIFGIPYVVVRIDDKEVVLKAGKDFNVTYPDSDNAGKIAYADPGEYRIVITGKGNYMDSVTTTESVLDGTVSTGGVKAMSRLNYRIPNATFTEPYTVGMRAYPEEAKLEVKDAKLPKDAQLLKGKRFESKAQAVAGAIDKSVIDEGNQFVYFVDHNDAVGTGRITFIGVVANGYKGTVVKNLKISGGSLNSFKINGVKNTYQYTGSAIEPAGEEGVSALPSESEFLVYKDVNGGTRVKLVKGVNYKVSYVKNVNMGTGTVVITGINNYSGVLKKNFKIIAKPATSVSVNDIPAQIYLKGGAKPSVELFDKVTGYKLQDGKDYSVIYTNNKNVHAGESSDTKKNPAPRATIKLKGNYSGSVIKMFAIKKSSLANGNVSMTVSDIVYKETPGLCKPVISLIDVDGVKLKANIDYSNSIIYTYEEFPTAVGSEEVEIKTKSGNTVGTAIRKKGDTVENIDIVPINTVIRASITAKENGFYDSDGSGISQCFRFVGGSVAKATVTVVTQNYSGREIKPVSPDVKVTMPKVSSSLVEGLDYEIIGYKDNIKKGKAKLTIRGIGNYGGTKEVTFNIVSRSMSYLITYDSNIEAMKARYGDSAVIISGTMKEGMVPTGTKLAKCGYKCVGSDGRQYKFVGWCTKPSPSDKNDGIWYADQETFRLKSALQLFGKREKLYAQWE